MLKKFCIDCGSKFEYNPRGAPTNICDGCARQDQPQESSAGGLDRSSLTIDLNNNPSSGQPSEEININSLKSSFLGDISQTKQASSNLQPQSFKAENIIASAPDPNFKRQQRQAPKETRTAEEILGSVAQKNKIEE